jgi:hypothetical protein
MRDDATQMVAIDTASVLGARLLNCTRVLDPLSPRETAGLPRLKMCFSSWGSGLSPYSPGKASPVWYDVWRIPTKTEELA